MRGFSEVLIEENAPQLNEQGRNYISRIIHSAARMDSLLTDLLAYSKVSRTRVQVVPVRVEKALQEAQQFLEEEIRQKQAAIEIKGPLPPVLGHHGTLVQVLLNLLGNSIKFVRDGQRPAVVITAKEQDAKVRIFISDNGIGIPEDSRIRLFKMFERLPEAQRYPGTGMGLAIVQKGMNRMGGSAGLLPLNGCGTTFWIELPLAQAVAEELASSKS
jgi:signal transduction histidine kinase